MALVPPLAQPDVPFVGPEEPGTPSLRAVASRLARASALYGLSNFAIRAINFLLLPVYTHYLTPSDYGAITLAETVALFMLMVFGLGFDSSIQRLYFEHVGHSEELASYIGSVSKFALFTEVAAVVLTLTLGPIITRLPAFHWNVPFTYLALAVATASATQFFQYRLLLFQAEHRPRPYAVLAVISFLLTAAACVSLVAFAHRGATGMLQGKLAGAAVSFLIAIYLLRHALARKLHWRHIKESLRVGVPVVPHLLMAGGLIAADRFILGHYRDLREVGLYALAYTFGMMMSLVTLSLQQAWAPIYYDLARKREQAPALLGRASSGIMIALAAIACIGALASEDFIRYFLNARYQPAARLVPWIIAAYLAHSMFSLFSLSVLQSKRTQWLMFVSAIALFGNLGLDFLLIPRWGMYGAAYGTVVAYVIEAFVMYFVAQRVFRLNYDVLRILAGVCVFCVALTVTQVAWNPAHRLLVMTGTGIFCLAALSGLGLSRLSLVFPNRRTAG